jgi:hypothetical protein
MTYPLFHWTDINLMHDRQWRWHRYRQQQAEVTSALHQFRSVTEKRRYLRRRLARSRKQNNADPVRWFVWAVAYIRHSAPDDSLAHCLEASAFQRLLDCGIRPPKSSLCSLFADLFEARLSTLDHPTSSSPYSLYHLLAAYTRPGEYSPAALPQPEAQAPYPPIVCRSYSLRDIRRLRFAGQLTEATARCQRCRDRLPPISARQYDQLSPAHRGELWCLAYALRCRRGLETLPHWATAASAARPIIQLMDRCNRPDAPLLQRLYDYVRFKLAHTSEGFRWRLFFSAAALRWLFRSHRYDFARHEAHDYMTLSLVVSKNRSCDALGIMPDVLSRLFPE